jgi:type IV pilus assembly protein PilM
MAIQPGVWGIDLGQCGLKALRVEMIEGKVTATAFDYVEHPKILSQPDADPDQLTREALEKFLSRNTIRGDLVVVSIPGQSGLARFVKLPPVEEKKIPDIVRFEAKQQIPFNLEEVVWDYQKVGSGVVTDGFAMETEIGLFAIKRDTVTRYLQHFKDVNVEVHIVQMAPLALCNYVSFDLLEAGEGLDGEGAGGKKQCVVALDIGTDSSNLVITDGQRIIWQRPIPLGGNHFTRALTKDMKLTFAKAEHLKRNATKSPDLKQILSSLKPVLNDFVGEVQRSLGYFTNTHRDANVLYMVGLGSAFRLPGLQKFISEKLQLDVRRLQKLEKLVGDEVINAPVFSENVLSFAVAYGLALQGLKVSRLHTNLLPQDIRVERMIRAKKPWAVAAAAALLLGTFSLALGYNRQYQAVAATPVKNAMDKGKEVVKTANTFKAKVDEELKKIKEDQDAVRSIIIGQDERYNWMLFNQFVNAALPSPDGSNLSEEARKIFWNSRAQEAYKRFNLQQAGSPKAGSEIKMGDRVDEESWRDDLIQANVESVYCIYCFDLATFHKKLTTDRSHLDKIKDTMNENDFKTAPTGTGWLVEVKGYTWNKGGYQFISKAIVDNFARLPIRAQPQSQEAKPGAKAPAASSDRMTHPIWNHVSHAVLYTYNDAKNPDPLQFQILGNTYLDKFAGGTGLTMGGVGNRPGEGGTSFATGGSNRAWSPLSSGGGSVTGRGGKGGGQRTLAPQAISMERGVQMGSTGPARTGATTAMRKDHTRTEFVIFFVWQEPSPSDKLLTPGGEVGGAAPAFVGLPSLGGGGRR